MPATDPVVMVFMKALRFVFDTEYTPVVVFQIGEAPCNSQLHGATYRPTLNLLNLARAAGGACAADRRAGMAGLRT
jgi:hypothetical protein